MTIKKLISRRYNKMLGAIQSMVQSEVDIVLTLLSKSSASSAMSFKLIAEVSK